jgi:CDP-diacylglycerol--serine O-phosphatidyltransferase
VTIAGLAFSKIPTLSLKATHINPRLVPLLLVGAVVLIGGIVTMPLLVVLVMSVVYLLHLPFAFRTYRWLSATPEAWTVHGSDRRAIRRTTRRRRRIRL